MLSIASGVSPATHSPYTRNPIFRLLLFALVALSLTVAAHAETVTLDSNFGNYHAYNYVGGLEYVGPYPGFMGGGGYIDGVWYYLFCLDINVPTNIGVTYQGSIKMPTTKAELAMTYLMDRVFNLGGYAADVNTIGGPFSMAIWEVMNPSSINPAAFVHDPAAATLVLEANNAVENLDWTSEDAAKYAIWVPNDLHSAQRFGLVAIPPPPTPTPEPSTMAMLGSSLIGVYFWRRRKN